jgi:hypothetical protein
MHLTEYSNCPFSYTQASPQSASVQSDQKRNFDVIRFATRHQGTKIKTHIIPSRLRGLLFFLISHSKFDVGRSMFLIFNKIACPDEVRGRVPTGVHFHGSLASRGRQEGLQ